MSNELTSPQHEKFLTDMLLDQAREQIAKKLKDKLVSEFEKEIEPQIKDMLQMVTLESISYFRENMTLNDKYFVHFKFNDDDPLIYEDE